MPTNPRCYLCNAPLTDEEVAVNRFAMRAGYGTPPKDIDWLCRYCDAVMNDDESEDDDDE